MTLGANEKGDPMSKIAALRLIDPEIENEMGVHETNNLAQKVERVIYLLEGEKDMPGLVARVSTLEELLIGRKGNDGMAHQVRTMWRIHVWLLCTFSAAFGFVLNILVGKLIH